MDATFVSVDSECESESVYDAHEVGAFEGSATDEAAINVRLGKEFGCVGGLAAAAVENRGVVGYFLAVLFGDYVADMCVHVFGLLCGSGLAGADSPYGFVGENELAEVFGAETEESLFNLLLQSSPYRFGFRLQSAF